MVPCNVSRTDEKLRRIAKAYLIAKQKVIEKGYAKEIDWQYEVSLEALDECTFLRESAWVILNSGMRESVVRQRFGKISEAFYNWQSAVIIAENAKTCREIALRYFNHKGKIAAILSIVKRISHDGFSDIFHGIKQTGIKYLRQFPFLGPVTSIHLAKNIGLSVAKPDRHLIRLVSRLGYKNVQVLCEDISRATDDPVPVIDIVLWRFSTLYRSNVGRMAEAIGAY